MLQSAKQMLSATVLLLTTSIASAHVGHDHSSWESPLMHALFYSAIAFAGVATVFFAVKKNKTAKQEQDGDQE